MQHVYMCSMICSANFILDSKATRAKKACSFSYPYTMVNFDTDGNSFLAPHAVLKLKIVNWTSLSGVGTDLKHTSK